MTDPYAKQGSPRIKLIQLIIQKLSDMIKSEDELFDWTDGTTLYHGWAKIGSKSSEEVWKISKTVFSSGNPVSIGWADSARYSQKWDDRMSGVYSQ